MKKSKFLALALIMMSVFLSGCFFNRDKISCRHKQPLFKKYQPRLQGGKKWNYKKHQGPKRKLLK